jgi:cytochrome oxidase Cu insertion factor (SCO1/SenC/PrrC family)
LFYQIREGTAASGYLVDHTTPTYLIDPEGNLLMVYPYDTPASGIVADLQWFFENES